MDSAEFAAARPVLQAAYAHHALTAIHPFADGNGRVARALASVFLYRAAGVPLVIFSDQQEQYWDALADADAGRTTSFVRFIDDRATDTMGMVADRLREVQSPLERRAAALRSLLTAHSDLTHAQIFGISQRLAEQLKTRFTEQFAAQAEYLKPDVWGGVEPADGRIRGREAFNQWPYHQLYDFVFMLSCEHPARAELEEVIVIGAANDLEERFAFIVVNAGRPDLPPLKLRVSDLHPAISAATETRIDSWVRHSLSTSLAALYDAVSAALEYLGYSPPP